VAANLIEITITAIDNTAGMFTEVSGRLSALDGKIAALAATSESAGAGISAGLGRTSVTGPTTEIEGLRGAVAGLSTTAETAASGTTAGLTKISAAEATTVIGGLKSEITGLSATAETAATGATTGLARTSVSEPVAAIGRLKAVLTELAPTGETAATGTTTGLGKIGVSLPETEINRLKALVAELPASAVDAAGGTDVALARIAATEAKANIKTLDLAIKELSPTATAAGMEASAGLSKLVTTLPEAEVNSLKTTIASLPETAVTAVGGTDAALNRLAATEGRAKIKAFDGEIAALAGTGETAGKGLTDGIRKLDFTDAKTKVTEFGTHILDMAKRAGEAIGLIGLAGGALDLGAVKMAADYQTNTTNVQNNTTMTPADVATMTALAMSQAGTAGVRPSDTNQAFMHAENLTGNADISAILVKIATESAVSTGDDPTKVTNILAQMFHEYGFDKGPDALKNAPAKATELMGQAHLAAANANMTLPEFSQNFGQISAWAANLGVPPDQAMATYAMMTKHGFDPAEGATQVKDIFPHIVKPSAGALKESASLDNQLAKIGQDDSVAGEATTDSKGNKIGAIEGLLNPETLKNIGLTGIFDELHKKFEALGLDEAQQTAEIMKLIPNIRGGAATFTAIGQGAEDYKNGLAQLNDKTLTMSVTHDAFARTQGTLQFQWNKLKATGEAYLIQLGEKTLPLFTRLVSWLTDSLPGAIATGVKAWESFTQALSGNWGDAAGNSGLVSFFGTLGVTIHNLEPAFTTLKGVIGDVFSALGTATKFVQDHVAAQAILIGGLTAVGTALAIYKTVQIATELWTVAQWLLNAALTANPVGIIIVAIAALAAGFIYAYGHSDRFRAYVNALWDGLKEIGGWIQSAWSAISTEFGRSFDWLGTKVHDFITTAGNLFSYFGTNAHDNLVAVGGFFSNLGTTAHDVTTGIGGFFNTLGTTLGSWRDSVQRFLVTDVGGFFSSLGMAAQTVKNDVGGFFNALGTTLGGWRDTVRGIVQTDVGGFFSGLGTAAHTVETTVGGFFSALGTTLGSWRDTVQRILVNDVGGFFSALGTVAKTITDSIGNFFDALGFHLGAFRDNLATPMHMVGDFFSELGTKAHDVTTGIGGFFDTLGTRLGSWRDTIKGYLVNDVGGFFSGLGTAANTVKTDVGNWFSQLGTTLGGWRDTVKGIIVNDVGGFFSDLGIAANTVKTDVGKWFNDLGMTLGGWRDTVKGYLVTDVGGFFSGLGTAANTVKTDVGGHFNDLGTVLGSWRDTVRSIIVNDVGGFFSGLGTTAQTLKNDVGSRFSEIGTALGEKRDEAKNFLTEGSDSIGGHFSTLGTIAQTLKNDIGNRFSELGSALGTKRDEIKNFLTEGSDSIGGFFNTLGTTAQTLKNDVGNRFNELGSALGTKRDEIKGIIVTDIGGFFDSLGTKANTFSGNIQSAFNGLKGWLQGWGTEVKNFVLAPFEGIGKGIHDFLVKIGDGINWVGGLFKFNRVDFSGMPGFAGGLNWQGGPAWVGEKGPEAGFGFGPGMTVLGARGPEIRYVPKDATIVPHDESRAMGLLPGFAGGLFGAFGDAVNKLKELGSSAVSFLQGGAESAVATVMQRIGAAPTGHGVLDDYPAHMLGMAKDGIGDTIKNLLEVAGATGGANPSGGGGVPPGGGALWDAIRAATGDVHQQWAMAFGAGAETGGGWNGPWPDQYGGGPGRGPFQIEAMTRYHMDISENDARDARRAAQYMAGDYSRAMSASNRWDSDPRAASHAVALAAERPAQDYDGTQQDRGWRMVQSIMSPEGNAIIKMAESVQGTFMWCEKFVGDVMERLGKQYSRATNAEEHSHMQSLSPGLGPAGSIVFYPYTDGDGIATGHVAFSGGDGRIFGTTQGGTGWGNGNWTTPYGYTQNPRADGGWIDELVLGRGMRSGQTYSFGEHEREYVVPQSQMPRASSGGGAGSGSGGGGGGDTHIHLAVQGHVLTERDLVDAVYTGFLQKKRANGALGLS